jgi:uncharacterized protein (TIGR00661 family)
MNILFGIQTTGNGHISRAQEILPRLMQIGHVTILLSGEHKEVQLPCHHKIQLRGLTYAFDNEGRVSISKTAKSLKMTRFLKDVNSLDLSKFDLILNDFEPITAWAAKIKNRGCFSLSHQSSFLSEKTPRPSKRIEYIELLMKYFAPSTCGIGFHFERYDDFIMPPVIKSSVQNLNPNKGSHYTVYLPAYKPEFLESIFTKHKDAQWQIFSPQAKSQSRNGNVLIQPTAKAAFTESLENCQGVVTAGGFELCAESMFLGKKLFSIPIINQYEQLCNAAAMQKMGISTAMEIGRNFDIKLIRWMEDAKPTVLNEIANLDSIMEHVLSFSELDSERVVA